MVKIFRWLKLKTMISVLLFAATIVLLIAETIIRQQAYEKYNQLLYEKNEQMLITYSDYLDTMLSRMENLTYSMIADDMLQDNLTYVRDNGIGFGPVVTDINSRLYNYVSQEQYFDSFYFQTDSFGYRYGKSSLKDTLENFEEYLQAAKEAKSKTCWFPLENCLIMAREIRKSENLELTKLACVVAQVNFTSIMENMNSTLKHMDMDGNVAVFFDDICVYSNATGLEQYKNMSDGWIICDDNFVTVYTSKERGYTMVVSTYYGEVQQAIKQTYMMSLIASVAVAGVVLAVSSYFVSRIIKELHLLIERMDDFGAGILPNESDRLHYENMPNEIGKLYRHFHSMTVNYKKLSDEDYNNKLLLKDAEFSHMQKQMQPHFMLNSLSIIRWKAYALQDQELTAIVDALGRIVRGFMQSGSEGAHAGSPLPSGPMASVRSEMQMVEDYLYIQQFRFQERLKVEIQLSEPVLNLQIPRLCIQPLVENSITYAMDEMLSECRILIFDRHTERDFEIIVEDNGPGFDEDILERLEQGVAKPGGHGTALRNIQKRLQYAFSEDYGLRFVRLQNGMQVVIKIPIGGVSQPLRRNQEV